MMKKYFYDSSLIIEGYKGNQHAKFIYMSIPDDALVYTNAIVISEVAYILIFKKCCKIFEIKEIFDDFIFVELLSEVINLAFDFMEKYNLKPNDAMILATCKYEDIPNLVSLDEHFVLPCKMEGINLVNQ